MFLASNAAQDGGLFDEDGSVLCRAGRHFGRIAGPIKEGDKLARLGHQRDDDHTRAPIHLTGQDRGWQQDSQREREKEREREREKKAAAGRADWGQRADAETRLDFFAPFGFDPPRRVGLGAPVQKRINKSHWLYGRFKLWANFSTRRNRRTRGVL